MLAIDIDSDAIDWAVQNIFLNGGFNAIELSIESIETIETPFQLICANLILSEIVKLLPHLSRLLEPGGSLIVSGILVDQVDMVNDLLEENRLFCLETLYLEEWACMILGFKTRRLESERVRGKKVVK